MGMSSWASCAVLLYLVLLLTPSCPILFLVTALPGNYLAADASTSWTNSLSAPDSVKFDDGSFARIILLSNFSDDSVATACGCGFICNQTCNSHHFAIFSLSYDYYDPDSVNISKSEGPKVVWSANPENPVSINATLQLTSEEGLALKDANGTTVWSTNIGSKSVAGLNFTDVCNLQLLDDKNATVWQSFDHPTDTLVVGQKLVAGQQLTSQGGLFSFSVTRQGFFAYINSNPPQRYLTYTSENTINIQFFKDNLAISSYGPILAWSLASKYFSNRYMRLGADNGHLEVYNVFWGEADNFFSRFIDSCGFPTVCGSYDAKAVVDVFKNPDYENHVISPILDDCRQLAATFQQIQFNHCYRQANRCVDMLARMGAEQELHFLMFNSLPVEVLSAFEDDCTGVYFNRLCPELDVVF
ncbi:hypothetical protein SO802_001333 [Lithocarpus litseifolius]|uniref:Bulb-type lectin domain-containing protein n=1 Tax=Lithocarpus litseifolius TaxID=425828 RepID=A0AAW2DVX1_9ROSI